MAARRKKITKKDMKELAAKYGDKYYLDERKIRDKVYDMESDGVFVTRDEIEDMILNDDFF